MKTSVLLLTLLSGIGIAAAADHSNLEEGLPAQIEDAFPTRFRAVEFQGAFRYDRTDNDKDRFVLDPRIEFGFAPNWQGKISVPFYVGSADRTDSGDLGLEALYNFNMETRWLPAFAAAGRMDLPTGEDSAGVDTTIKFIFTKTISSSGLDRLHFNAAWKHNAGEREGDRENLYRLVFGYSRRLGADTILVLDFIRQQEQRKREEANIFELGLRRQITPLLVISGGVGVGVGDESPDIRFTLGVQKTY